MLNTPLNKLTICAFDTETTGAYPLGAEVCEIACVKWREGQVIDTYQSLVKPSEPMSDFIIGIHGITNEMVAEAPSPLAVMPQFLNFIKDSVIVAHHAAFDMGFIMAEVERQGLQVPTTPALCSSILSRQLINETENHKLQTLVKFFGLDGGTAHRALDDSKSCLEVIKICIERFGPNKTLGEIIQFQNSEMTWPRFSIEALENTELGRQIIPAIRQKKSLEVSYKTPRDSRVVKPIGIVRNPEGDYVVVTEEGSPQPKRFYWSRIIKAKMI